MHNFKFYLASKLRVRGAAPPLPLYAFMALLSVSWRIWRNSDEQPNACQDSQVIGQIWNRDFQFTKQDYRSPNSVVRFNWCWFNFRSIFLCFPFRDTTACKGSGRSHGPDFTIALRHTTRGRTPLDERSARCRHLYLTARNSHKRITSMLLARFEATIPASEWPQTHALDRGTAGIGRISV